MKKLPENYRGREHSYIKHQILEAYLKRLFMIIGLTQSTINYVDCFSGPWQDDSETLDASSIGISLRIMSSCQSALKILNRNVKFRALFIEKDKKAHSRLAEFLEKKLYPSIETKPIHGEFATVRTEILDWCGGKPFTFFFIDPKGWKDMGKPTLELLLKRQNSEFLINFMYEHLNRFLEKEELEEQITELLGYVPNVDEFNSKQREEHVVRLYRNYLKKTITGNEKIWSARVNILHPTANRTKYPLIYLTKHPKGMQVFMEESEKLDMVQKQIHLTTQINAKIEKSGQIDILANDLHQIKNESQCLDDIKDYWLKHISTTPRSFNLVDFANFLEETNWMPGDFQQALGELIKEGRVKNLDAKRTRPKNHINFEKNEMLQLIQNES